MVERLRLYRGATELNFDSASIIKTDDVIINTGKASIEEESTVTPGSTIDFKKADGSTVVFSTIARQIKRGNTWSLNLLSNGEELQNKKLDQIYTSQAPEDIVQDVIDNQTDNLTFASTATSGVTITKYISNGNYLYEIIRDMMDATGWIFRIDENDNVYFEPKGTLDNGVVYTNGTDGQVQGWERDAKNIINHVTVVGGFENFLTSDTFSATGTVFTLTYKPNASVKVLVSAVEQSPDTYTVNAENNTVTFNASTTDPTIEYTYNRPIQVEYQDDASITAYGEVFKKIPAPWLNTTADARQYAKEYVKLFKDPSVKCTLKQAGLNFDVDVGERMQMVDNIRSEDEIMIIKKIVYKADDTSTILHLGSRDYMLNDWQNEVQDRVKKLERRFINDEQIIFSRSITHGMNVDLSLALTFKEASPNNSFCLSHTTLGRLRSGDAIEADCSDNSRNGTWLGTGVTTGAQFSTSGHRLSTGVFNGSDRRIDIPVAGFTGTQGSISCWVKTSSSSSFAIICAGNTGDGNKYLYIGLNAGEVRITQRDGVGDTTDTVETTSLNLDDNAFHHVVVISNGTSYTVYVDNASKSLRVLSGTNSGDWFSDVTFNSLNIGAYEGTSVSNYFSGSIDEVRVYSSVLTASEIGLLYTKFHVSDNQLGYYSMDAPVLGNQFSARTTVS